MGRMSSAKKSLVAMFSVDVTHTVPVVSALFALRCDVQGEPHCAALAVKVCAVMVEERILKFTEFNQVETPRPRKLMALFCSSGFDPFRVALVVTVRFPLPSVAMLVTGKDTGPKFFHNPEPSAVVKFSALAAGATLEEAISPVVF